MPIYCFYTVNALSPGVSYQELPWDKGDGYYRIYRFSVYEDVLQDFSDSDGFAIINFLNHTELSDWIKDAIQKESDSIILKDRIRYVDRKNTEWICADKHPYELFYKGEEFSYQNEARIVIPDKSMSFIDYKKRNDKYRSIKLEGLAEKIQKKLIKASDLHFEVIMPVLPISK